MIMEKSLECDNSQKDKRGSWFIFLAVCLASLSTFVTGSCFVWTSPQLPKFNSSDPAINLIGRPLTTTESAWIVSAMSLGLIFGPTISVLCMKFTTKKITLLIAMAPMVSSHVICIFASQPHVFIVARLLMGISTGAIWAVLGTYIGEIAEDRIRGLLGCIPGIMSNLGSLMVNVIGPYLNMSLFSIAIIFPLILFYIGFGIFVPDSPYDLIMKGKRSEAKQSLRILRRHESVERELSFMEDTVRVGFTEKTRVIDLIRNRILRKGLLISVSLMTIQQLSGILAVACYAEVIFRLAGDFLPSSVCPMIMGIVGTIFNVLSSQLVDKMGRKILLTTSCSLESISLFALGTYFYGLENGFDMSPVAWLPIASLMLFIASFNVGLGIVPWVVTGEIFHSSVKSLAATITALANYTVSFIVTICFPYMVDCLGMGWTFGTFAIIMVFGALFCGFVLQETKGKSFQEIQKMLDC